MRRDRIANEVAARYDRKIAGAYLLLHYPSFGQGIDQNGAKLDNVYLAQRILDKLEAASGVAIGDVPSELAPGQDPNQTAWRLEVQGSAGGQQQGFVDRLRYLDSLKVRGMLLPERAILKGQHGTLAESQSQDIRVVVQERLVQCNRAHRHAGTRGTRASTRLLDAAGASRDNGRNRRSRLTQPGRSTRSAGGIKCRCRTISAGFGHRGDRAVEAKLEGELNQVLKECLAEFGVVFDPNVNETLRGLGLSQVDTDRPDGVFGHIVYDYKAPGKISNAADLQKAKDQIEKKYLDKITAGTRPAPAACADWFGYLCDGVSLFYCRSNRREWQWSRRLPMNESTLLFLVHAYRSLHRKPLTAPF